MVTMKTIKLTIFHPLKKVVFHKQVYQITIYDKFVQLYAWQKSCQNAGVYQVLYFITIFVY